MFDCSEVVTWTKAGRWVANETGKSLQPDDANEPSPSESAYRAKASMSLVAAFPSGTTGFSSNTGLDGVCTVQYLLASLRDNGCATVLRHTQR